MLSARKLVTGVQILLETKEYLITEKDAARMLGVSTSWLQKARCQSSPSPNYVKLGGAIRYRHRDIIDFIEQNYFVIGAGQPEGRVR